MIINYTTLTNTSSYTMEEPAFDRSTELYCVMALLSFLGVMGTAGNTLVLYVFYQKKDKQTSTLFILALAFVDFMTCLIVIPYTIYMEYVDFNIKYDLLCKLYQFLITSSIPFTALMMVAIAIDRYFCICHPFLHAITIFRAKIICFCLGLCAICLGIIVGLMFGVYAKMPTLDFPQAENRTILTHVNSTEGGGGNLMGGSYQPHDASSDGSAAYTVDEAKQVIFNNIENETNAGDLEARPLKVLVVYTGHCSPNHFILSEKFMWNYQKFYTAMYLLCLIIVIVLYCAIYRSVLARRTKRQKQKSKSLTLVMSATDNHTTPPTEETQLTVVNGETTAEVVNGSSSKEKKGKDKNKKDKGRRKSTKKDRNRMANLKTAAMLFVVTIVFVVTYLPAFLMALEILPYSMIIFYMYFANNVANPVIYSFMNKNFRDDLKKLFCGR